MSIFMHIEGIKGECSDANHKGWVDIERIKWGTKRNINSHTSTQGDRESSNAIITDLSFIKLMDKATPYLFIETCCGRGKTIKIVMTKTGSGNGADVYTEYTLTNALLSKMHIVHNGLRPVEDFTISFTSMTVKYISYDEDGNLNTPEAIGFDTATNTKI